MPMPASKSSVSGGPAPATASVSGALPTANPPSTAPSASGSGAPAASTSTASSGGLSGTSSFNATASSTAPASSRGLFGASSSNPPATSNGPVQSGGLFGASSTNASATPTGTPLSAFGSATSNGPVQSGGLFGASSTNASATPTGTPLSTFGSATCISPQGFAFGLGSSSVGAAKSSTFGGSTWAPASGPFFTTSSNSTSSSPRELSKLFGSAKRHYWEFVVFQVEGLYFKVPRYHFEKSSEIFCDIFLASQGNTPAKGSSRENPIKLDGVQAVDFERFMEFLYPSTIPWREESRTDDDWKSILKLATLWRFIDLRKLAIDKLTGSQRMTSAEKILLGRQCSVTQWVRSGYIELIMQTDVPSMEILKSIGFDAALRVFRAREDARKLVSNPCACGRAPAVGSPDESKVQLSVDIGFAVELLDVSRKGAGYQEDHLQNGKRSELGPSSSSQRTV
ncbi:hypothetical protein D9758_006290 [Tetrapyrgos nigripes]|uniref:BTB domain-containing protein n=1 Tax=Tetrapyrgos nigripes TaxID=182062 RepID=A0A8H5G0D6_9AGAR|nr:hypothetical protein D9758_006290 [Tetrapyrgos nigripes]